jgi:integrase
MKGQFKITPCEHGQSRYLVQGCINGQRIRSYHRLRAEAEAECYKRNIELKNFGHEIAGIPVALRVEALACLTRLAPLKVTLTQATDYYLAQYDWQSKSVPVSYAWADFRAELERKVAAIEIGEAHLATSAKQCKKLVAAFGTRQICDLKPDILSKWLSALPLSATSRNSVRVNLSGLFSYAKRRNWIEKNPISEVASFRTARIKAKLPGILSVKQTAALLENAEAEILPHFALGLFAGLRVAEIGRLDWSDIDFAKKTIDVKAEVAKKTSQRRWVPMSDNLVVWLVPHSKAHGPVAPQSAKEYFIQRARRRAGITDWPSNALRHSFCSYHFALYEDAPRTASQAGHSGGQTQMLFAHYRDRVTKEAAQAYFSIVPVQAQNIVAIAV